MQTVFDAPPVETKRYVTGQVDEIRYDPPSEEEILTYQQTTYPEWLSKCRGVLEGLHKHRTLGVERIPVRIALRNDGSRPALNAFVSFQCEGECRLFRVDDDIEDADEGDSSEDGSTQRLTRSLPKPPEPPSFSRSVRTIQEAPPKASVQKGIVIATLGVGSELEKQIASLSANQRLREKALGPFHNSGIAAALGKSDPFGEALRSSLVTQAPSRLYDIRTLDPIIPRLPTAHDPEAFYYKRWPVGQACRRGGLACDRWRHQSETEVFEFEVILSGEETSNGVLVCNVHAENMTIPFELKVPMRREIIDRDLQDDLEFLIEEC
ncbi:MAG: hypothetical protein ACRBBV_15455 [Paracoccaceae bacterium]